MTTKNFSKTRHELNNKIATMDASLSAFRIYLQRLSEAQENNELYQKSLKQLKSISVDMLTVSGQIDDLIESLNGAEERT